MLVWLLINRDVYLHFVAVHCSSSSSVVSCDVMVVRLSSIYVICGISLPLCLLLGRTVTSH